MEEQPKIIELMIDKYKGKKLSVDEEHNGIETVAKVLNVVPVYTGKPADHEVRHLRVGLNHGPSDII